MRTTTFITPKSTDCLSIKLWDKDLNEKLVILGKRLNLNMSELVTMLCRELVDAKIEESERSEYEMLNEDAKVDTILELKRKLKEAGIDA